VDVISFLNLTKVATYSQTVAVFYTVTAIASLRLSIWQLIIFIPLLTLSVRSGLLSVVVVCLYKILHLSITDLHHVLLFFVCIYSITSRRKWAGRIFILLLIGNKNGSWIELQYCFIFFLVI